MSAPWGRKNQYFESTTWYTTVAVTWKWFMVSLLSVVFFFRHNISGARCWKQKKLRGHCRCYQILLANSITVLSIDEFLSSQKRQSLQSSIHAFTDYVHSVILYKIELCKSALKSLDSNHSCFCLALTVRVGAGYKRVGEGWLYYFTLQTVQRGRHRWHSTADTVWWIKGRNIDAPFVYFLQAP